MGSSSVSLWLAILGMMIGFDAVVGGVYLFRAGKFCRRFIVAVAIYIFAIIAGHHAEVADYLYDNAQYILIAATAIVIFVALYDMTKIVTKHDRKNTKHRRHNHHRPYHITPAH